MPIPWLTILDTVVGTVARRASGRTALASLGGGGVEARLVGAAFGAIREVFDRDSRRLEEERLRLDEERARAERLLRLELLRQAADREIARLRLLAAVALASVLGTLLIGTRVFGGAPISKVAVGVSLLLLLAGLAGSLNGQGSVAREMGRADDRALVSEITSSIAGTSALWLIIAGIAVLAIGVLVS